MSESHEIEVKLRATDAAARLRSAALKCELEKPRHFEENFLLDTLDRRLADQASALRVRLAGDQAWITFKGKPQAPDGRFKVREELETAVADGHRALQIFERLGYRRTFAYQKWRTVYRLELPDGTSLQAMVDETPLGEFLELEGSREAITAAAAALGFAPEQFITSSYPALQAEACRAAGRPLGDMVFPPSS